MCVCMCVRDVVGVCVVKLITKCLVVEGGALPVSVMKKKEQEHTRDTDSLPSRYILETVILPSRNILERQTVYQAGTY